MHCPRRSAPVRSPLPRAKGLPACRVWEAHPRREGLVSDWFLAKAKFLALSFLGRECELSNEYSISYRGCWL